MGTCCQFSNSKTVNEQSSGINGLVQSSSRSPRPSIDREVLSQLQDKITIESRVLIKGKLSNKTQDPFSKKETTSSGVSSLEELKSLGISCRKGLNSYPNQDTFCVILDTSFAFLGVFDGHGQYGHDISNFVSSTLPDRIIEKTSAGIPGAFKAAFQETNDLLDMESDKFSCEFSGTTASVVLIQDKKLSVGHVGDSRIVLGVFEGNDFQGKALTEDHTPKVTRESNRINEYGGIVKIQTHKGLHRVCNKGTKGPGLSVSRSIGDFASQQIGVICEPEHREIEITSEFLVLILASDGVWDVVSEQEAVNIAAMASGDAQAAAERLTNTALSRWLHEEGGADDITAVVFYLPPFV